jgi:transcriptional regulator with XRE-family HTH domain
MGQLIERIRTVVKDYRRTHNISQARLARQLDCGTPAVIGNYESGKTVPHFFTLTQLFLVCLADAPKDVLDMMRALGLPVDEALVETLLGPLVEIRSGRGIPECQRG